MEGFLQQRNSSVPQNLQFLGSPAGKGRQALWQLKHFSTWEWQKHHQGGQGYVVEYGLQFWVLESALIALAEERIVIGIQGQDVAVDRFGDTEVLAAKIEHVPSLVGARERGQAKRYRYSSA